MHTSSMTTMHNVGECDVLNGFAEWFDDLVCLCNFFPWWCYTLRGMPVTNYNVSNVCTCCSYKSLYFWMFNRPPRNVAGHFILLCNHIEIREINRFVANKKIEKLEKLIINKKCHSWNLWNENTLNYTINTTTYMIHIRFRYLHISDT